MELLKKGFDMPVELLDLSGYPVNPRDTGIQYPVPCCPRDFLTIGGSSRCTTAWSLHTRDIKGCLIIIRIIHKYIINIYIIIYI